MCYLYIKQIYSHLLENKKKPSKTLKVILNLKSLRKTAKILIYWEFKER